MLYNVRPVDKMAILHEFLNPAPDIPAMDIRFRTLVATLKHDRTRLVDLPDFCRTLFERLAYAPRFVLGQSVY